MYTGMPDERRISGRRGGPPREARYWHASPDRRLLLPTVQPGPPAPYVSIDSTIGIVLSVGVDGNGDDIVRTIHPGHARWLAMRLVEAAAIWEQGQTENVRVLFSE